MHDPKHQQPRAALKNPSALAVIDTNVVLDWLVFDAPRVRELGHSLVQGQMRWLATEAMLAELADVLGRPAIAKHCPDLAATMACARSRCRVVPERIIQHNPAPRCADPDDQMFIDLAWSTPTGWLFSRDRALLELARPALVRDLRITTPALWPGLDQTPHQAGVKKAA